MNMVLVLHEADLGLNHMVPQDPTEVLPEHRDLNYS